MKTPKRILVPTDLSKAGEEAIDYAAMLCGQFGSTLVITTNVNLPERAVFEEFGASEGLSIVDAGKIALRRFASERAPDIPAEVELTFAEFPAPGILQTIEKLNIDLVVIASHGRGGVKRLVLGSVAEVVTRRADVPVLIVPVREPAE